VQATLGLDATHASQLSAPFYSWAAAAGDALVVPIPCDDDECSAVRSPRSEYALGLVRYLVHTESIRRMGSIVVGLVLRRKRSCPWQRMPRS